MMLIILQEGHTDMATLLIEHNAAAGACAKNGLTPLHLCGQEDRVNVAAILVKHGAQVRRKPVDTLVFLSSIF